METDKEGGETERMCEEETTSEGTRCREIMMETQHESQRKTDEEME